MAATGGNWLEKPHRTSLEQRRLPQYLRSVFGDRAGGAGDQQADGQQSGSDAEGA